jgi:hypothetical protein
MKKFEMRQTFGFRWVSIMPAHRSFGIIVRGVSEFDIYCFLSNYILKNFHSFFIARIGTLQNGLKPKHSIPSGLKPVNLIPFGHNKLSVNQKW